MKQFIIIRGYGRNLLAADRALEKLAQRIERLDLEIITQTVRLEDGGEDCIVDVAVKVPNNMEKKNFRRLLRIGDWDVEEDVL